MGLRWIVVQTFWCVEFSLPIVTSGGVSDRFRPGPCLGSDYQGRVSSPSPPSSKTDVSSAGKVKLYGTLHAKRGPL
jgi:hypothetical protein